MTADEFRTALIIVVLACLFIDALIGRYIKKGRNG